MNETDESRKGYLGGSRILEYFGDK